MQNQMATRALGQDVFIAYGPMYFFMFPWRYFSSRYISILIFLLLGLAIRLQHVCHTNATIEFDVPSQVLDSQEKYA